MPVSQAADRYALLLSSTQGSVPGAYRRFTIHIGRPAARQRPAGQACRHHLFGDTQPDWLVIAVEDGERREAVEREACHGLINGRPRSTI